MANTDTQDYLHKKLCELEDYIIESKDLVDVTYNWVMENAAELEFIYSKIKNNFNKMMEIFVKDDDTC